MEIRLFAPLSDETVKKFYADSLAQVLAKDSESSEYKLELVQLRRALEHRAINPSSVPPMALDADEFGSLIVAGIKAYEEASDKMSDDELIAYYIRLAVNNLDDFAATLEHALVSRNIPHFTIEQLKVVQADMAEIAKPDEEIIWGDAEHRTHLHEGFKLHHAWARPDSEHDPSLHKNLKPQIRSYKDHYWPVNTGG